MIVRKKLINGYQVQHHHYLYQLLMKILVQIL